MAGKASSETATVEDLLKAARTANRIASNGEKYNNVDIHELTSPNRYPILQHWEEKTLLDRKPWLEKLNNRIFELDSRVKKVAITQGDGTSDILFFNSEGKLF